MKDLSGSYTKTIYIYAHKWDWQNEADWEIVVSEARYDEGNTEYILVGEKEVTFDVAVDNASITAKKVEAAKIQRQDIIDKGVRELKAIDNKIAELTAIGVDA